MYTSFPWHWKESFVKKSTSFYACDHFLNSHKPNALFGSDTMYRYCTGSWVQIPYRPYFHYCSSSVHYCKDRLHIQFFICSSLFFSYIYCQCFSDEKLDTPCFILIMQGIPSTYNKDLQVRFMAENCRKICNPFTTLFSIKTCDLRSSGNWGRLRKIRN